MSTSDAPLPDVPSDLSVVHRPERQRFEVGVDGRLGEIDYQLVDGQMWITHTGVPAALEGRGIAGELVRAAVDHARAQGLKVKPVCSYAAGWMRRHPETADLLVR